MIQPLQTWSDSDFDQMSWHDCRLYGLKLLNEAFEMSLDIDYILEWIPVNNMFRFSVSPCLIMFANVSDVRINLLYRKELLCFVSEIERSNKRLSPNRKVEVWDYRIVCDVGNISFTSTGFQQKAISTPKLMETQDLNRDYLVIA